MKKAFFIIPGDPVAALRVTQRQMSLLHINSWRLSDPAVKLKQRIQKYLGYKSRVTLWSNGKGIPRRPKSKVDLYLCIWFRNKRHPDPDNVFKLFSDAIFERDKNVVGKTDFWYDSENPRVEITIRWEEEAENEGKREEGRGEREEKGMVDGAGGKVDPEGRGGADNQGAGMGPEAGRLLQGDDDGKGEN